MQQTFRNIIHLLKLSRYCTNSSTATDTTPCVQRKCSDNTQATDNATCASFLPKCISNGKGCVDQINPCASMKGNQENLIRYLLIRPDLLINLQLINPLKMIIVKSKLANQQKTKMMVRVIHYQMDISKMEMEGVLRQMLMTQLEQVIKVFWPFVNLLLLEKIYISQIYSLSLYRQYNSNKIENCEDFKVECIVKSEEGRVRKSKSCSQQSGTVTFCPNFSGDLKFSSIWTKVKCTKYYAYQVRFCSNNISPQSAKDCLDHKSTCRFLRLDLHTLMQQLVVVIVYQILQLLIKKRLIILQVSKITLSYYLVIHQELLNFQLELVNNSQANIHHYYALLIYRRISLLLLMMHINQQEPYIIYQIKQTVYMVMLLLILVIFLNKLNVEGLQMKRTCRYIENSCKINYSNRFKDVYRFNSFGKQRRMLKSNRFKLSHYIRNLQ
ncbi:unnamed protein product [Paramecium primaurelia]|uniref:Uncharacterized protein n=1 Tax=Paramecium primaurelia TaxID=5886 RepID=A0A8S1N209_PARPR|nr:unnamed protein product [Paramecium primaurelia]